MGLTGAAAAAAAAAAAGAVVMEKPKQAQVGGVGAMCTLFCLTF